MLTKLAKIVKITLFLGLCTPCLLFGCGDIEKKNMFAIMLAWGEGVF